MNHRNPEAIARGEEAMRLLSGPVFAEAFDAAIDLFVEEWRKSKPEETSKRELAWAKLQGLDEVRRQLRRIISQGEYASRQPDER